MILTMGVDWFIALELHGDATAAGGDGKTELRPYPDGSSRPVYSDLLAYMPGWAIAEGEGGNHYLYQPHLEEILKTRDRNMGGRWTTGWLVRNRSTGEQIWKQAAHLTAGDTKAKIAEREAQGENLAKSINPANPFILGIDGNNARDYAGSPRDSLQKIGLRGLRQKASVLNGSQPSHHGGASGQWIDDMYSSDRIGVEDAELVPTPDDILDHNWLKAKFTVLPLEQR